MTSGPHNSKTFIVRIATMGDKQLLIIPKDCHYDLSKGKLFVKVKATELELK